MKILSYIRFTEMNETIQWLEKHNVFFAPCNLRKSIFVDTVSGEIEIVPTDYLVMTDQSDLPDVYAESAFLQIYPECFVDYS